MYIYWQIWPRFTYKNYMINFTSLNYNWNWIFKNTMKTHTMYIPSMASRWSMKKGRWGGGGNCLFIMITWCSKLSDPSLDPTSLLFYERNWSETTCIIYWFRKMKRSKYTWRYNINFIELSLFGFFREINSDTNSNTWIFAYKFHKNVRENVKTGIFFFKFSSLYLVCGTCIDHAMIQKIYLDL